MKKITLYLITVSFAMGFLSCADSSSEKVVIVTHDDTLSEVKEEKGVPLKYDMIISDIPFPFEILDELYEKNITFNQDVLNPVSNSSKYNQYNSKALNLGIYGADLAYAVTFEQFQQIGSYVKNTKRLAEDLNIPLAFNQAMLGKYEKHKENKDSLARAVYDSYTEVDKALKNNEREGMAALVVAGSWLEGLYISGKTFLDAEKNDKNKTLYKTISGQKESLTIIIKLLNEYNSDPFISKLNTELKEIRAVYTGMAIDEKGLMILHEKVAKLRKNIVDGL
ncbi:MAG: hypothetical protein M3R27_01250 [Bacteroidota bacterium]|nr:hypothetical protein [Bacteroidota bacterium]